MPVNQSSLQNVEVFSEMRPSLRPTGCFGCNRLLRFVVGFMMILLSAAARIGFDRLIRFEIGLVASLSSRAAFLLALAVSELSTVVVVIAIVSVFPCR